MGLIFDIFGMAAFIVGSVVLGLLIWMFCACFVVFVFGRGNVHIRYQDKEYRPKTPLIKHLWGGHK